MTSITDDFSGSLWEAEDDECEAKSGQYGEKPEDPSPIGFLREYTTENGAKTWSCVGSIVESFSGHPVFLGCSRLRLLTHTMQHQRICPVHGVEQDQPPRSLQVRWSLW